MRKITLAPLLLFHVLFFLILGLGVVTAKETVGRLHLAEFQSVVLVITAVIFVYGYAILVYRGFLHLLPLKEGAIAKNSRAEFGYHIYLLFYLLFFQPLIRTRFIPVPLMRVVYILLGARLGTNTFSGGTILDPPLLQVGSNTLIGEDALLYAHAIEGEHLAHARIVIGDSVTIGARAIIMSGVTIGDRAIVAAGAVVLKGTRINSDEVWAGLPARLLYRLGEQKDIAKTTSQPWEVVLETSDQFLAHHAKAQETATQ